MVLVLGMMQPRADATNVTIGHAGAQATADTGASPVIRRPLCRTTNNLAARVPGEARSRKCFAGGEVTGGMPIRSTASCHRQN